jgi:hypothetical protein
MLNCTLLNCEALQPTLHCQEWTAFCPCSLLGTSILLRQLGGLPVAVLAQLKIQIFRHKDWSVTGMRKLVLGKAWVKVRPTPIAGMYKHDIRHWEFNHFSHVKWKRYCLACEYFLPPYQSLYVSSYARFCSVDCYSKDSLPQGNPMTVKGANQFRGPSQDISIYTKLHVHWSTASERYTNQWLALEISNCVLLYMMYRVWKGCLLIAWHLHRGTYPSLNLESWLFLCGRITAVTRAY